MNCVILEIAPNIDTHLQSGYRDALVRLGLDNGQQFKNTSGSVSDFKNFSTRSESQGDFKTPKEIVVQYHLSQYIAITDTETGLKVGDKVDIVENGDRWIKLSNSLYCIRVARTVEYYRSTGIWGNFDPATNGERYLFSRLKPHISVVFDVGCRSDTEFLNYTGEVHYFEPDTNSLSQLKCQPHTNRVAVYNPWGLGDQTGTVWYYPKYQSFYDRTKSCGESDVANRVALEIRRADEYIKSTGVERIDFLKIDTEGCEMNVLRGFGEEINRVEIIQFEYGGTYLDCGLKLGDIVQYLSDCGFFGFSYITPNGLSPITDFTDHYTYCNITAIRKGSRLTELYTSMIV